MLIGIDFDSTLAHYTSGSFPAIGNPIMPMVDRVKKLLEEGHDVVIFTARGSEGDPVQVDRMIQDVKAWCRLYIGRELPVTSNKHYNVDHFYDDRAKQVIPETGQVLEELYIESIKRIKELEQELLDLRMEEYFKSSWELENGI